MTESFEEKKAFWEAVSKQNRRARAGVWRPKATAAAKAAAHPSPGNFPQDDSAAAAAPPTAVAEMGDCEGAPPIVQQQFLVENIDDCLAPPPTAVAKMGEHSDGASDIVSIASTHSIAGNTATETGESETNAAVAGRRRGVEHRERERE